MNSTSSPNVSSPQLPTQSPELRFSIASIMFTTGTFAVLLTYLKLFEPAEFFMGLKTVGLVTLIGIAAGAYFDRVWDVALWSSLGAMTAFLCGVGEPLTHESFQYAWPLVGALTAASAILFDRLPVWHRMAIGAFIGFTVLAVFAVAASQMGVMNTWMEVVCGPVAGAIMVGVVWVLEKLRTWRGISRSVLIFSLAVGVIGGNVFGRWIGWL